MVRIDEVHAENPIAGSVHTSDAGIQPPVAAVNGTDERPVEYREPQSIGSDDA